MTPTWTANKQNIKFEKNVMSIIAWLTWWSPWPSSTKTTAPSSWSPATSPLPSPGRQRWGPSAGSEGWDLNGFYRPVIKICELYLFCLYLFNRSVMKVFKVHLWSISHQYEFLYSLQSSCAYKIDMKNSLQKLSLWGTSHLGAPALILKCDFLKVFIFQFQTFPAAWGPCEQEENEASAWCTWCSRVRAPLAAGTSTCLWYILWNGQVI